jgi:hypothetical protein
VGTWGVIRQFNCEKKQLMSIQAPNSNDFAVRIEQILGLCMARQVNSSYYLLQTSNCLVIQARLYKGFADRDIGNKA